MDFYGAHSLVKATKHSAFYSQKREPRITDVLCHSLRAASTVSAEGDGEEEQRAEISQAIFVMGVW